MSYEDLYRKERSCSNCEHSYVDNLFYEYRCRFHGYFPDLDKYGDPVENTKCKKWEKENDDLLLL